MNLFKHGSLKWTLLCLLWVFTAATYFNAGGNDMKATDPTWGITATDGVIRKTQCLQVCSRNTDCGGCNFKEDGVNSLCEILPPTAVVKNSYSLSVETGWQFYRKVPLITPEYVKSLTLLCMPYDGYSGTPVPRPLFQPISCTAATYLENLWTTGHKDCKFTRQDNKNFKGFDITSMTGNAATMWQIAFSKCHIDKCVAIVCLDATCWLKNQNHITESGHTGYIDETGVTYWYATCQ